MRSDDFSGARMKILVSIDISVLGFYGYIGDISVDIFTSISISRKLNCCDQYITVGSVEISNLII